MIQKYRKDALKSFSINLTNQFTREFKMSRTQLTQKYPSPYFKENCLTKEIHKKQLCLIYKEVFIYRKPFQQDRQRLGQKCLTAL